MLMELLHKKSNVYTYSLQPELSKVAEDSIPYGNWLNQELFWLEWVRLKNGGG